MTDLDIWLSDVLVARTVTRSRGGKISIEYTDEGLSRYSVGSPVLSCSLPAFPGPAAPAVSRAFLEGLLPEGRALEVAAARLRGVHLDAAGAPATPADAVALLLEYGRECAGAVSVMPSGQVPPTEHRLSEPLSGTDLDQLIQNLPTRPLGADPDRDIRMSLGGAQDKLLLTRVDGRWHTPHSGHPSTHILKPTTVWPYSAENEALILALSRMCGLSSSDAWVEKIGATSVLVAQRYDRIRSEDGTIIRIHQEDMCQASGLRPKDKYHIGRPSQHMSAVLRAFANSPRTEISTLFKQVAFRCLVGDEDGHGKNYSLLLHDGTVEIAPIYDTLCTLEYPTLSGKMATRIGVQSSLAKVDRIALLNEARAMGIPQTEAESALDELAADLRSGIENLPGALTDGWPVDHLIDTVQDRTRRLETGEPLGAPETTRRPRATLDAATTRRRQT